MKRQGFKIFLFLTVYYAFSMVLVIVYSFVKLPLDTVLPCFCNEYKMLNAFNRFIDILPALQLSGLLVGYSWFFSRNQQESKPSTPQKMFDSLKGALLTILFCMVFTIVAAEVGRPIIRTKITGLANASFDYRNYLAVTKQHMTKDQYELADFYIQQVLTIDPLSEEAHQLKKIIEVKKSDHKDIADSADLANQENGARITEYELQELIKKAENAFYDRNYFEAHYYATLAIKAMDETNASLQRVKMLASDAWNKLSASQIVAGEAEKLFERKKEGYSALMAKDILKAYYIFKELYDLKPKDPDVIRYLALAKEALSQQYFFIDETSNLQSFETVRNIPFVLHNSHGGKYLVFIKGLTAVKDSGKMVQYLRGLNIAQFDEQNNFVTSFEVSYAKMTSELAVNFGPKYVDLVKKGSVTKTVPYIILESVDRDTMGAVIRPHYSRLTALDFVLENNTCVLPMSYEDFLLIAEASVGAENMPLFSLYRFLEKAPNYGYSSEAYAQIFYQRICLPLLLLVLSLLAVILGWKFRISSHQMVKFWWLLTVPLFWVVAYVFVDLNRYVLTLLTYTLIGFAGKYTLFILVPVFLLLFFIFAIMFTAQREE